MLLTLTADPVTGPVGEEVDVGGTVPLLHLAGPGLLLPALPAVPGGGAGPGLGDLQ